MDLKKNWKIKRKSLEYSVSIFPNQCDDNFTGLYMLMHTLFKKKQ